MANELAVIERELLPRKPIFEQLVAGTGVPAERIMRSVLVSCERTPKLLECTPMSILQAATTGAVLGLEADGYTGQGYLVPFWNGRRKVRQAQWLTGYKGYNTIGARAGLTIDGGVVREGDDFDFQEGTSPFVHHKKRLGAGTGRRIIAAYAQATAPNRTPIIKVLDIDEINAVRDRSQASKRDGDEDEAFSPWSDPRVGFPAMAEKTAKRRLARSLPLSVYISAARVDEAHDEQGRHAWLNEQRDLVIDGQAQHLTDAPADTKGPGVAALSRPTFKIRPARGGDISLPTIEQWRGRMMSALNEMSPDAARVFWERNADIIDGLNLDYREAVQAVAAVYRRRTGEQ